MLRQTTTTLSFETRGRGLREITRPVLDWVAEAALDSGLLTRFIRHPSASLQRAPEAQRTSTASQVVPCKALFARRRNAVVEVIVNGAHINRDAVFVRSARGLLSGVALRRQSRTQVDLGFCEAERFSKVSG
ncbi:MAG: hypothetical protein ABI671_01815 [Burkholderiales bacterium]